MSLPNLTYLKPTAASQQQKTPYSDQFEDVYFNTDHGLIEAEYVFISGNHLIQRWQQADANSCFCIGETGFGTGLNFLTTCQAWRQSDNKPHHLHFFSVEKYPLSIDSLQQAHKNFAELQRFSQPLLDVWGQFRNGFHTFTVDDDITLTLAFGDVHDQLKQLEGTIDAWFLDGFAPQKNPDMWRDEVFDELNRLSTSGTSLATFTAASSVRKGLEAHGFSVTKKPGYGKKREMITAQYDHSVAAKAPPINWHPWPSANNHPKQATIIGGGIAGMCLARNLKKAGYHTTVVDHQTHPMQRASGNAAAMVMPLLTAQTSPESLFYLRAFEYACRFYQPQEFFAVGVTEHLNQTKQHQWAKTLAAANLPKELISFTATTAFYSQAGYVDTSSVAQRLLPFVDHWLTVEVDHIRADDEGYWRLFNQTGDLIMESELLIVANGINAQQLLQPSDLSLIAKHGQTSLLTSDKPGSLKSIQLDQGYLIPTKHGKQLICGATFDHIETELGYQTATLHADHAQRNIKLWQQHPLAATLQQYQVAGGHAAIRATTPDHLPICGPIIDQHKFRQNCADLHHGRHWQTYPPAQAIKSLYVLSGLGSRGFTSAPLLAQQLTAMITAEPLPLERDLCKIIHPNRFLYRQLKKRPEKKTQ